MAVDNLDKKIKDRLEAVGIVGNELVQKLMSNDTVEIIKIAAIYERVVEYKTAMEVYKLAAEKNNAYAAFKVGELYSNGHGVRQNHFRAVEWYMRAYKLGYDNALFKVKSYIGAEKRSPEDSDLDFRAVNNILRTDITLTPIRREMGKEPTLKRHLDVLNEENGLRIRQNPFSTNRQCPSPQQPPNDASNNKRKAEQEVEEETNKKTKALEDKIEMLENKLKMGDEDTKLLEDKIKSWEEKAKMGEDKAKLWEEKASILQQSNQSLITLLEQEKQIKNNQVNLLNQKIEDLENMNKRTGGSGNIKLEEI